MMNSQDVRNCVNNWSTGIPEIDSEPAVKTSDPVWTPSLGQTVKAMVILLSVTDGGICYVLQNLSHTPVRCSRRTDDNPAEPVNVGFGDDFIVDEAALPGLSDFGIARHLADDVSITVTGGEGTSNSPWLFAVEFARVDDDDDSDDYSGHPFEGEGGFPGGRIEETRPSLVSYDISSAYPYQLPTENAAE